MAEFNRGISHEPMRMHSPPPEPVANVTREQYHAMVERAKEYIRAGDIFQVVPSQRFELPFRLPPFALYRALRRLNPSPFLFFLDLDGYALVGSSPEILVRLRDGEVTVRPIAGTRRRGADKAEDEALAQDLMNDPKELAEHLMLLDLGRNDVGRVAKIGTVRVTEKMKVEYYSHVMHIVSNVEGAIRPDCDALDALMAGFPAGTVSGAPKVRAMEIIDELEPERRGFYAGAVGYFAADGTMDSCIALRTALVKDGRMYVQAGGGVVADSDPEAEYQESCNKARALIRAAEEAVRFASGSALSGRSAGRRRRAAGAGAGAHRQRFRLAGSGCGRSGRRRGRCAGRAPRRRGSRPRARTAWPDRDARWPERGRAAGPGARPRPAAAGRRSCVGTLSRNTSRAACGMPSWSASPSPTDSGEVRLSTKLSPRRRTSCSTLSMLAGSAVARLPMWLFSPAACGTRSNAQARRRWKSSGSRPTRIAFGPGSALPIGSMGRCR